MTWTQVRPWGEHQGKEAWLGSDCGIRDFAEFAATLEPTGAGEEYISSGAFLAAVRGIPPLGDD